MSMNAGRMRAVIYCRVSSEEQVEGTSLTTQDAICRAYCAREGWDVAAVFSDRGESAKTADRPEFQAAIAFATGARNRVDRFVVYKLDRFARSQYDYAVVNHALTTARVRLVSATEQYGADPSGTLLAAILAAWGEFDNKTRADRSRTAMREMARMGFWTHKAPYGYRVIRVDGRPTLGPDFPAAGLVSEAFHRVDSGWSISDVLAAFAARGARGPMGRAVSRQLLHRVLRDPLYCGRLRSELTDWQVVPGRWEALVPGELFDRVQIRLDGAGAPQLPRARAHDAFPLRGTIRCEHGHVLTAAPSRGRTRVYGYFWCHQSKACPRVRAEKVETAWLAWLEAESTQARGVWPIVREMVTRIWQQRAAACDQAAAEARRKIEANDMAQRRLLDLLLAGTVTEDTYRAKVAELTGAAALLKVTAAEHAADGYDLAALLQYAHRMLADLPGLWRDCDAPRKRAMQAALFPDGVILAADGSIRTAGNSPFFNLFRVPAPVESCMAPHSGHGSNLIAWAAAVEAVRKACAA